MSTQHIHDLESAYGPSTDLSGLGLSMPSLYQTHGSRRGRRALRKVRRTTRRVSVAVWLHRFAAWLVGGQ